MSATRELISHPEKFLRKNLLSLSPLLDNPALSLLNDDGTIDVRLTNMTDYLEGNDVPILRNRNRKGFAAISRATSKTHWEKSAQIYKILPAAANDGNGKPESETFKAYICPYQDKSTRVKFLRSAAQFMFTGDMDGCTFGVGHPALSGGVLVGHSNRMDLMSDDVAQDMDARIAPQRAGQASSLSSFGLHRQIAPDVYRSGEHGGLQKAITIGVRTGAKWKFWYQHQRFQAVGQETHMLALTPLG